MTQFPDDKLSKDKIRQLLDAVGTCAQDDASIDPDAPEYDWRQCQYFNLEQCARLSDFTRRFAIQCGPILSRLFNGSREVTVVEAGQFFAADLFAPEVETDDYVVGFGADAQEASGLISIPRTSAMTWTTQLLGGGDDTEDDAERPLSSLEESLLLDIAGSGMQAFVDVSDQTLQLAGQIMHGQLPVEWAADDALYKITLESREPEAESGNPISFILSCGQLETVAGKTETADERPLSPEQIKAIMLEHIHEIPVSVMVELGAVKLDFGDVIGLEVNDVLVLEKKVSEPVDLRIHGKPLQSGHMAQSDGHYAIAVV